MTPNHPSRCCYKFSVHQALPEETKPVQEVPSGVMGTPQQLGEHTAQQSCHVWDGRQWPTDFCLDRVTKSWFTWN